MEINRLLYRAVDTPARINILSKINRPLPQAILTRAHFVPWD
jgi:hypothetical protein